MLPNKNLLFLFGEDTYRSREKLRAIIQRYLGVAGGDTNLVTLEAARLDRDTFAHHVEALPFLASTRLVIVRNLCLEGTKSLQDAIADYLSKIPVSTIVLFYESGVPDRRTRLFRTLKTLATATEYPSLSGSDLTRHLARQLTHHFGSAPTDLVAYLTQTLQGDLWRSTNEIEKLRLFLRDRPLESLTQAELHTLIPLTAQADVFALIDTCLGHKPAAALGELDRLLDQGANELYLLTMLQFGFRSLALIVDAIQHRFDSTPDISRYTGVNPYVVRTYLPFARRVTAETIVAIYQRLLETDVAIKTGRVAPRDGLERLLLSLTGLGAAARTTNPAPEIG